VPAIFNTDQGCQFTSDAFTATLDGYGIRISMDGVNRALDNIYIERFWRTQKYEDLYLNDYRTLAELKAGIKRYMDFYNRERFHASHDYQTPDQIYANKFQSIETGLCAVA
jgi:putative transposase